MHRSRIGVLRRKKISSEVKSMSTNEKRLNVSDIMLIAMTRGMLGAGIGLLAAGKLTTEQRRTIGRTLMIVGAVTTVPLVWRVFGQRETPMLNGVTA
jgi:hypothetical protein